VSINIEAGGDRNSLSFLAKINNNIPTKKVTREKTLKNRSNIKNSAFRLNRAGIMGKNQAEEISTVNAITKSDFDLYSGSG
jgi:hypothetical protein|tara:strand:- start:55 stop:297 length:243 start_codon:yes stop_codon:yes gene_type:complete